MPWNVGPASENQAGGSAHSPRRRCAEPSHAGMLVDPDRLESIMATMRPFGNGAAATVSNYRPQRRGPEPAPLLSNVSWIVVRSISTGPISRDTRASRWACCATVHRGAKSPPARSAAPSPTLGKPAGEFGIRGLFMCRSIASNAGFASAACPGMSVCQHGKDHGDLSRSISVRHDNGAHWPRSSASSSPDRKH
jgi:hypothetical protein